MTKIPKEIEARLKKLNFSFDQIRGHVGTPDFIIKLDRDNNVLFIGLTGKMIVLSHDNRLFKCNNLYGIYFLDGTKAYQYTPDLIKKSSSDIFYVDLSYFSLEEITATKENPKAAAEQKPDKECPVIIGKKIIINEPTSDEYKKINWNQFIGQDVKVFFRHKNIEVPQQVVSLGIIEKENPALAAEIKNFLRKTKSEVAEVGMWIMHGKRKIYTSDIFTSRKLKQIVVSDAFPSLANLIKDTLQQEKEEDIGKLTLMHTHFVSNSCLSPSDWQTIQGLAEALELGRGDMIEILAIPQPQKGKLIFRHRVFG